MMVCELCCLLVVVVKACEVMGEEKKKWQQR